MVKLTPRQKNWLEGTGAHIGTATLTGNPTVIVVENVVLTEDHVLTFKLTPQQLMLIESNIFENPRVSLAPGGIGSIRAAYQFKGNGTIVQDELRVEVDEIYSTKPGPEAGLRLDTLKYNDVLRFEASRWADDGPPH